MTTHPSPYRKWLRTTKLRILWSAVACVMGWSLYLWWFTDSYIRNDDRWAINQRIWRAFAVGCIAALGAGPALRVVASRPTGLDRSHEWACYTLILLLVLLTTVGWTIRQR